jgi:uncharacterized protein YprB with RNaseH-like and TPR domain
MQNKSDIILEKLLCIHRHDIDSHPGCFLNGLVKDKVAQKYSKITGNPWYTYPGYKIGYFDIETDNLNADYGTLLTWTVKEKGGSIFTGKITQRELFTGDSDKRVVTELVAKLKEFSIIVGYYSTGFDLPFIRTRAMIQGIDFPPYGQPYHFDLYYTVRNKFALSRNGLGRAVEVLVQDDSKTHCGYQTWARAKYGDPNALDEILEYNMQDVIVTEKLHDKIAPFATWQRRSI